MSQSTLTQSPEITYLPSAFGGYNVVIDSTIVGSVKKDETGPATHQWFATWGPNAEWAAWGPTRKAAVEQARHLYERAEHEALVEREVAANGIFVEVSYPSRNTTRVVRHLPHGHRIVSQETEGFIGRVEVYEGTLCTLSFEHTSAFNAAISLCTTLQHALAQQVG